MDMNLQIKPRSENSLVASYACPCGCNPRVTYAKDAPELVDGCCCGNEFAVGPGAGKHLHVNEGFTLQVDRFQAPWGQPLEAAWTLGASSEHADDHHHDDHHHHDEGSHADSPSADSAIDPVCGMTVVIATAHEKDLHLNHEGRDFFFCGKGCKLEFGDDPARYLDPSYVPSM